MQSKSTSIKHLIHLEHLSQLFCVWLHFDNEPQFMWTNFFYHCHVNEIHCNRYVQYMPWRLFISFGVRCMYDSEYYFHKLSKLSLLQWVAFVLLFGHTACSRYHIPCTSGLQYLGAQKDMVLLLHTINQWNAHFLN
jgi:hypothetical protein